MRSVMYMVRLSYLAILLVVASPAWAQFGPAPMLYQYQGPSIGGLWTPSPSAGTSVTGGSTSPCSTTIGGGLTAGTITSNCGFLTFGNNQITVGTGAPTPGGGASTTLNNNITLDPTGGGNIVLFSSNAGDTGMLQFANSSSIIPATGFASCPGITMNKPPLGVNNVVTGFIPFMDWLGNKHGWPVC